MDNDLDLAVRTLREVILDEGSRPDLRRRYVAELRSDWPRLWEAIDAVLAAMSADSHS